MQKPGGITRVGQVALVIPLVLLCYKLGTLTLIFLALMNTG